MINVVTAVSRPHMLHRVAATLEDQQIQWHLIPHAGVEVPRDIADLRWVTLHKGYEPGTKQAWFAPLYDKLNWFIGSGRMQEDEYYGVLNDDDFMCPDALIDLGRKAKTEVAFISMHWTPGHAFIAKPGNMRVGQVGVEQYYALGRVWRQHSFLLHLPASDGHMGVALRCCHDCAYFPDIYCVFNALEPDRWSAQEISDLGARSVAPDAPLSEEIVRQYLTWDLEGNTNPLYHRVREMAKEIIAVRTS